MSGPVSAPPLPKASTYSPATRRWYETWASSPQATKFVGTDWARLAMLAPLVDRYFGLPDPKLLTEIRINESLLGATVVDRLRLRWAVETPAERPPERPRSRYAHLRLTMDPNGPSAS